MKLNELKSLLGMKLDPTPQGPDNELIMEAESEQPDEIILEQKEVAVDEVSLEENESNNAKARIRFRKSFLEQLKNPSKVQQDRLSCFKLCQGYVSKEIALKCNLESMPCYPRGTKGYLLEDSAVYLFDQAMQDKVKEIMENKNIKLVLFEHTVMTVPIEYLRIKDGKNRKHKEDQQEQPDMLV